MKKYLILLVLFCSTPAWAQGRFSLGPDLGFAYQTHRTPNGQNLAGSTGFTFGLSGTYQLSKQLKNFALDYAVGYATHSRLTYRDTTLGAVTGSYREKIDVIHWAVGARYYFAGRRWRPFAGLGLGFQFFKRRQVEFRDSFNVTQVTPSHSNHLNFALVPQLGIEYRPSFRWAFGLSLRAPLSVRSSGVVPGIQVPFTVHFAF